MPARFLDYDPPRRWAAASVVGDLVFLAGEGGSDPVSREVVPGGVVAQTHQAMRNIGATLARLGLDHSDIVKLTIYLTDMDDLVPVAQARARYMSRPVPSSAVQVTRLALAGLAVEIEAVAMLRGQ